MKRLILAVFWLFLVDVMPAIAAENALEPTLMEFVKVQDSVPEIHPLIDIMQTVEAFIHSEQLSDQVVAVKVKDLDRRLRLAWCDDTLTASWSPGSRNIGRVTVQVQCVVPKPWRIHVQATVTMQSTVWALTRGVQRGDVLERDLLVTKQVTLGAGNTALASFGTPIINIDPWLGFVFAQRVNGGKVITERMLNPPKLVSKGEAVVIRHRSSGLELQTRGTALRDASAREQTQVRNTSSGKIIDVVVVAPGVVDILH